MGSWEPKAGIRCTAGVRYVLRLVPTWGGALRDDTKSG